MVDIFDEISGDLRAERMAALLRRYGIGFIVLAVLVLLAVGLQQLRLSHEARRDDAAAARYLALSGQIDALGTGIADPQRLAEAGALAAFASAAPPGYRVLARLKAAGLYAAAGREDRATALWNTVSGDAAADPLLRQLADLLWAQHEIGTAPDAAVAARLTPLTGSENIWHGLAQETQALLYLHAGNVAQAQALFSQIASDPSAPDGVRNRADGLLAQLNG